MAEYSRVDLQTVQLTKMFYLTTGLGLAEKALYHIGMIAGFSS